ncbi:PIN domain-containing protein [[Clostridium] fimetarium]|uniref:PIN domain-containing protein n=1 Tax=[Clostridium] fimetarium TaxID=99656 RepID=A0A1I0MAU6_9FIRM|nr:PIN domain-containing protein [[Clostridium] fimetarium]SEV85625.1 PIN domain-containing protein [[Clostridium] fimetarium]
MSEETLKDELLSPPGIDKRLIMYGLLTLELTEDEFFYAFGIREKHPQLSSYDALALAIAKKLGFVLLTGDKRLRKAAVEEGVEIRGTLWVFDELLHEKIVTEQEYTEFMKQIKQHNGDDIRLPISEIEKRIK